MKSTPEQIAAKRAEIIAACKANKGQVWLDDRLWIWTGGKLLVSKEGVVKQLKRVESKGQTEQESTK